MFEPDIAKKIAAREKVERAWEQKYGEPVPRVIGVFLREAPPDLIVHRFKDNPGPHVSPEGYGEGVDTAMLGCDEEWQPIIGHDPALPEISGDPKSLAERMVPVYRTAFERIRGRKPSAAELEAAMAVGRLETLWGTAKFPGGLGPGMHNHGAVQAGKPPGDPATTFESWDTHPLDSGGSERYAILFKRYASDEDGAADLIKHVGNDPFRMLRDHGNYLPAVSLGMYGNGYYEGFNASPAVIAANRAVFNWIVANAKKPPSGVSQSFKDRMARAADPIKAGRVLNHAIALNKNAAAATKSLNVKRATRMETAIIGGREAVGMGTGAIIGLVAGGGPVGAGIGALVGLVAGKVFR